MYLQLWGSVDPIHLLLNHKKPTAPLNLHAPLYAIIGQLAFLRHSHQDQQP